MVEHPKLAICAIVKDEARYIEEWLAFHFLQGVSQVLIFDNESTDGTRDILTSIWRMSSGVVPKSAATDGGSPRTLPSGAAAAPACSRFRSQYGADPLRRWRRF
jgi:hypothetical protein